ncbi:MAG: hypothetical protein AAB036_07440, partial [Elusimicrobiota bacterium]
MKQIILLLFFFSLSASARAFVISEDTPIPARRAIEEAVEFLASIKPGASPESPFHRRFFGAVDGNDYIQYLDGGAKEIFYFDNPYRDASALAGQYSPESLYIAPSFLKVDVVRRASV